MLGTYCQMGREQFEVKTSIVTCICGKSYQITADIYKKSPEDEEKNLCPCGKCEIENI